MISGVFNNDSTKSITSSAPIGRKIPTRSKDLAIERWHKSLSSEENQHIKKVEPLDLSKICQQSLPVPLTLLILAILMVVIPIFWLLTGVDEHF